MSDEPWAVGCELSCKINLFSFPWFKFVEFSFISLFFLFSVVKITHTLVFINAHAKIQNIYI